MPQLQDIYQRLRAIKDGSVAQSMAAALPTADPLATKLIVAGLLERQHPDGCTALVEHYDRLPPDLQASVLEHAPGWYTPLRQVVGRSGGNGPANVIRIVVEAKTIKLAYLVAEQLYHGPDAIRAQAAEGLLELARWVQPHRHGHTHDPAAVAYLRNVIEESVARYQSHQRPAVLQAWVVLGAGMGPALLRKLHNERDAAVKPLLQMIQPPPSAETRRMMLVLAQVSTLAKPVIDGIAAVAGGNELGDVLSNGHLLRCPQIVEPLVKLADPESLWPDIQNAISWQPQQTRALAAWAGVLPFAVGRRVELLTQLHKLPDPMSRLAAVRALISLSRTPGAAPAANEAVSRYCFDLEPQIAWTALRHLLANHWDGLTKLLSRLVNSDHPEVSRLARGRLAPVGFDKLWNNWPAMTPEQRLSVGRALIKIDPSFNSHVARKLSGEDRKARLRALAVIHTLNQGQAFEPALLTLVNDPDEVIVSAVVRALGSVQSPQAAQALEAALHHRDPRVRANAVESLQQARSTRHVQRLFEMAQSDQGRPRANAIRAMMQMNVGDAIGALSAMLLDPRPASRISALWVVEAMGLVEVARHVAEMSITDPDRGVKGRADRVIHSLIGLMNPDGEDTTVGSVPGDNTPRTQP